MKWLQRGGHRELSARSTQSSLPKGHRSLILIIIAWVLMGLVGGCQPIRASPTAPAGKVEMSFATIELRQPVTSEKTWTDPAPGLLVIATPADIDVARQYVSDEATTTLEQLDFAAHFALLAFDGWKSEGYQDFQIQAVVRQDAEVLIFAQPSQKPGPAATGVETSLYHLIDLPKKASWDQMITFKLYFDRTQPAVAAVAHYVP